MTSSQESVLEDILYGGHHGDGPGRAESATGAGELEDVGEEPITCAGCGEQVCERYFLLAAGRVWHDACLRCSQCHCQLQEHPSLFWRDGNIYCQQDYCRLFGIGRCARCSQPIPSSAMVMRSGELTFHPECFSCQECDVTLLPGNLYCMRGHNLYCQSHYHSNGHAHPSHDTDLKPTMKDREGEEPVSSPEPRMDDGAAAAGGAEVEVEVEARRQTKRIRTCFRSEQLRALESYFAQKHNPDGKDWTCLAHKTGLPKRVLQVWFQNARAKLRRSLCSDEPPTVSPSSASRAQIVAAADSPSLPPSPGRCPLLPPSTIDQLQLSLLTRSPGDGFFLEYGPQGASGRPPSPPALAYGGESGGDGEGDVVALGHYYC